MRKSKEHKLRTTCLIRQSTNKNRCNLYWSNRNVYADCKSIENCECFFSICRNINIIYISWWKRSKSIETQTKFYTCIDLIRARAQLVFTLYISSSNRNTNDFMSVCLRVIEYVFVCDLSAYDFVLYLSLSFSFAHFRKVTSV